MLPDFTLQLSHFIMMDVLANSTACFDLCRSEERTIPNTRDYTDVRQLKMLDVLRGRGWHITLSFSVHKTQFVNPKYHPGVFKINTNDSLPLTRLDTYFKRNLCLRLELNLTLKLCLTGTQMEKFHFYKFFILILKTFVIVVEGGY